MRTKKLFIPTTFITIAWLTLFGGPIAVGVSGCDGSGSAVKPHAGVAAQTSPARAAAETYRESVNTKNLDLLRTIFAEDVVLSVPTMAMELENPDGVFHGIDEAMEFFANTSFKAKAILTYTHVYEDENSCVVELKGRLPAGNDVEALDIFTVNDEGLVTRMTVYARIAS